MDISIKQLRALEALAQTGQFSRAAETLFITQPALSSQIASLESQLQVKLVERGARNCRLTPQGEEVLQTATEIFSNLQSLQDRIQRDDFPHNFAVGMIPTIAPYYLPNFLHQYHEISGQAALTVHEEKTEILLDKLQRGELHAVIAALPLAGETLSEFSLFEDKFYLASKRPPLSPNIPSQLPADELLLLSEGHCLGDQALDICSLTRSDLNSTASSLETLLGLVQSGYGLTLVPEIALPSIRRAHPKLVISAFDGVMPKRVVGLAVRKTSTEQAWVKTLIDISKRANDQNHPIQ